MIALWFGPFQATAAAQSYEAGLDAVDAADLPAAVAIWRELIAAVSDERPQAEYAMALLYETGQGVEWKELRAAELYASSGLPEALINLALMYSEGRGVDYDPTPARQRCGMQRRSRATPSPASISGWPTSTGRAWSRTRSGRWS